MKQEPCHGLTPELHSAVHCCQVMFPNHLSVKNGMGLSCKMLICVFQCVDDISPPNSQLAGQKRVDMGLTFCICIKTLPLV